MEKNLSIIQGLTATDQANPIRITDLGKVQTATAIDFSKVTILSDASNAQGDPATALNVLFSQIQATAGGYNATKVIIISTHMSNDQSMGAFIASAVYYVEA